MTPKAQERRFKIKPLQSEKNYTKGIRITNWYRDKKRIEHCLDNLEGIKTKVKSKQVYRVGLCYALYRFS